MKPVVKWVGGKTQLLPEIKKVLPDTYNTYFEAFLGGGALLFNIAPKKAIINDFNEELVNLYKVIKNNPKELIEDLKKHINKKEYFYSIRELDRNKEDYEKLSDVERASRILYLNKTCYNGLYRVNSNGEFNSPFGTYKNPLICDEENILELSHYFNKNNVKILNDDFSIIMKYVKENDFVYLDPPYYPLTKSASFTGYNANGFNESDQIRLKKMCDKLNTKGVKFLLSNSNTNFIKELYKDYDIIIVKAKRCINSDGKGRNNCEEVLIKNY